MNGNASHSNEESSLFRPLFVLALAFCLFLVFEAVTLWGAVRGLHQQRDFLIQQVKQAQPQVAVARTVQAALQGIANDLVTLGASDAEVQKIVEKYQIRRASPPSPSR